VPARSNFFQDVVALLHRNMAGSPAVEDSAMLVNRVTGETREVDIVIRTESAGYPLVVSIEATSGRRPADVGWVEKMQAKHEHLETNQLVLVSDNDFSAQARRLADHYGVLALAPEDLQGDERVGAILNHLPALWPKLLSLTAVNIRVHVARPNGSEAWFQAEPDHTLFFDDGKGVVYVATFVIAVMQKHFLEIADQIGLRDIKQDMDAPFSFEAGGAFANLDGQRRDFFVRWEAADPPELHAITRVEVTGTAHIEVREMALRHRRLGEIAFAEGQFEMAGKDAVVVVMEDARGKVVSMRWREKPVRKQRAQKRHGNAGD
jgi:hypothetical protein